MTCIAPMPTVEMKRRSSTSCVKGQFLHSCHRSNKKSKGSFSLVKTTQQADKTDTLIESPDDACPIVMFSGQNIEINKASDCVDKLDGTSTHLRKLPYSSPPDPISSERTGSLYSTCPSDLQTIFSPSFEIENAQNKMINQKDADSNEQNTLPHLVSDDSDDGSCSSSDFLLYGELDFCKFEDLANSQFIGDMGFTDCALDSIYTDFEHMNTNTMIDMTDRYMMFPFLEKAVETSSIQNEDSVRAMVDCDDACLYLAMHQMKSDQETNINYQFGELDEMECIDQQLIFRNLPDLFETASSVCPVWIQRETQDKKLITLVLDLDETLVHSTLEHCDDAAFSFPVFFNMKQHTVYVRQRPYLQLFLERVAQMFDVVIFTASQSIYAEQLLDILDPERNLISQRIYRESCIFSNGTYTKDLTVLGIDLAKVAIIDNSPQVFRLQVNNGIPIKSWFDDQSDSALISLLPFLETLVDADDVRPMIAKKFGSEE